MEGNAALNNVFAPRGTPFAYPGRLKSCTYETSTKPNLAPGSECLKYMPKDHSGLSVGSRIPGSFNSLGLGVVS